MEKVLLTGAAGFLGKAVRRQRPATDLFALDARAEEPGLCAVNLLAQDFEDRLPDRLHSAIHLAAIANDRACKADPATAWALNLNATLKLYEACARRGCRKFVFASSEWVYGDQASTRPWREEDPVSPAGLGVYALSKLTAEFALQQLARPTCELVILRLAILYGPRSTGLSAVESIACQVADNKQVEVNSGSTARRYLHVDDAASALLLAADSSLKGTYNLAGDRLISLRDVYDLAAACTGNNPGFVERDAAASTVRDLDAAKLKAELAWHPRRFEDGLAGLLGVNAQTAASKE